MRTPSRGKRSIAGRTAKENFVRPEKFEIHAGEYSPRPPGRRCESSHNKQTWVFGKATEREHRCKLIFRRISAGDGRGEATSKVHPLHSQPVVLRGYSFQEALYLVLIKVCTFLFRLPWPHGAANRILSHMFKPDRISEDGMELSCILFHHSCPGGC